MKADAFAAALEIATEEGARNLALLRQEIADAVARYRQNSLLVLLRHVGLKLLKNPRQPGLIAELLDAAEWAEEAQLSDASGSRPEYRAAAEAAWEEICAPVVPEGPTESDFLELRTALRSEETARLDAALRRVMSQEEASVGKRGPKDRGDAIALFAQHVFSALQHAGIPIKIYNRENSLDRSTPTYMILLAICQEEGITPPGEKLLRESADFVRYAHAAALKGPVK